MENKTKIGFILLLIGILAVAYVLFVYPKYVEKNTLTENDVVGVYDQISGPKPEQSISRWGGYHEVIIDVEITKEAAKRLTEGKINNAEIYRCNKLIASVPSVKAEDIFIFKENEPSIIRIAIRAETKEDVLKIIDEFRKIHESC